MAQWFQNVDEKLPGALVLEVHFRKVADWRIEVRSASSTGRLSFLLFLPKSWMVGDVENAVLAFFWTGIGVVMGD